MFTGIVLIGIQQICAPRIFERVDTTLPGRDLRDSGGSVCDNL